MNLNNNLNSSPMVRRAGLGRVLSIILSTCVFEADAAEAYDTIKRFKIADEKDMQRDMENQRNWNGLVENIQEIV